MKVAYIVGIEERRKSINQPSSKFLKTLLMPLAVKPQRSLGSKARHHRNKPGQRS